MKKLQRCGGSFCLPSFCVYTTTHICAQVSDSEHSIYFKVLNARCCGVWGVYVAHYVHAAPQQPTKPFSSKEKRESLCAFGKKTNALDACSRKKRSRHASSTTFRCPRICVDLYRFYMSMSAALVSGEIYKQIHVVAINIRIKPIAISTSGGAYICVPHYI